LSGIKGKSHASVLRAKVGVLIRVGAVPDVSGCGIDATALQIALNLCVPVGRLQDRAPAVCDLEIVRGFDGHVAGESLQYLSAVGGGNSDAPIAASDDTDITMSNPIAKAELCPRLDVADSVLVAGDILRAPDNSSTEGAATRGDGDENGFASIGLELRQWLFQLCSRNDN
jgi:hypothetical protein